MADRSIKLADFGLSIDATSERPVTRAGTLDYMAPEVTHHPHICLSPQKLFDTKLEFRPGLSSLMPLPAHHHDHAVYNNFQAFQLCFGQVPTRCA